MFGLFYTPYLVGNVGMEERGEGQADWSYSTLQGGRLRTEFKKKTMKQSCWVQGDDEDAVSYKLYLDCLLPWQWRQSLCQNDRTLGSPWIGVNVFGPSQTLFLHHLVRSCSLICLERRDGYCNLIWFISKSFTFIHTQRSLLHPEMAGWWGNIKRNMCRHESKTDALLPPLPCLYRHLVRISYYRKKIV